MIVKIFGGEPKLRVEKVYKKDEEEYIIGVDKGSYNAISYGLTPNLSIGDFDSVTQDQFAKIKEHSQQLMTFESEKDLVDTELAIIEALKLKPQRIELYGMTGSRLDHFYVNMNLLQSVALEGVDVHLIDEHNDIYVLDEGMHKIYKNAYTYLSIFAIEKSDITVSGTKYILEDYTLLPNDNMCISNEIIEEYALIETSDPILIIQSKDLT